MSGSPSTYESTAELVAEFDFDLPSELIAQEPLPERDGGRMLVVERATGRLTHSVVRALPDFLDEGDLLVGNNSRVFSARLKGRKAETGGRVELLLLHPLKVDRWRALARPVRRLAIGQKILVAPRFDTAITDLTVVIVAIAAGGEVDVEVPADLLSRLAQYGELPLPPYIKTALRDEDRYQTLFAKETGSAAAPTAGLHITREMRHQLRVKGIEWAEVTLHVGLDTFRPPTVQRIADHVIHREWCRVPAATGMAVASAKEADRRVVALGTTTARTLETFGAIWNPTAPSAMEMESSLFILPGYRWRLVDGLLTNFHLPRSTLLMMVSAFAGQELVRRAYAEAIERQYRFYSFGDAMLII